MVERDPVAVSRWSGVQRRIRLLAPRPIRRLDLAAFRALARTRIPIVGPLLPRLSRAANHSKLWFAIAGLLAATGTRSGRRAALRGAGAIAATSALVNIPAKLLTGRVRPDVSIVPEVRHLARVPMSTSFPSGHSASAFAFATAASLEAPRVRPPLLLLAGAVAISRVYTGVHYPGDVLVGAGIGAAIARATTRPWPLPRAVPGTTQQVAAPGPTPGDDGAGLILVANLGAGTQQKGRATERLGAALPAARIVKCQPDAGFEQALARAADEACVLGVAGGDGSASAAAAAAQRAGIPLAIVPTGTLNRLARDLGLQDVDDTVRAIRERRCVAVDVAEADGRRFVNALGVGFYPEFVSRREALQDRIGKWPAMAWSALRTLATRQPPYEMEIDGRRRVVWTLFVGNGTYTATGPAPTHRVHLDDGLLDVRLVDAQRRWSRVRMLWAVLTGRMERAASYERWTATRVDISIIEGPVPVAYDGEITSSRSRLEVRKDPRSLVVMQPDGSPSA